MSEPLVKVENLRVHFPGRRKSLLQPRPVVQAVDDVSFQVSRGRTVGLVGESGCGKSTTGLALMRLIEPTAGRIFFDGKELSRLQGEPLRQMRKRIQITFQDPYSALNPRMTAGEIISEPLRVLNIGTAAQREDRVADLLSKVGLSAEQRHLYPHQFSGGQRQRIGIARALASDPDVIVCDEPVSALDVAIQSQVLNILIRLQREMGLAFLFISHDLAVVQHISHEVIVMYLGRIVEQADRRSLFTTPLHPYTRALLSSVPSRDPDNRGGAKRLRLQGDLPSPSNPPSGCRFRTRCPFAAAKCAAEAPPLRAITGGRRIACHFVDNVGQAPWLAG